MSDVELYGRTAGSLASRRDVRASGRAISRYQSRVAVRESVIDAETDLVLRKIDNVTLVAGAGMQAVVRVAQAQQQLEQLCPAASARLNLLADDHALGVADAQQYLRCTLRRV